ncbi:cip1-interacting zinc finger protein [Gastrophryne carolinensis]
MFNQQQQQQFHQLIQLQHLLQQHQQHSVQTPAHHPPTTQHPLSGQHATPRAIPNTVQQPQQMLNLRPATPTRILNAHPMIQRALLMQQMQAGNLRGLNMVAPTMPPFFPTAPRHSILGIPPMGVTVKAPSMAFPPISYTQPRVYHKDHFKSPDTKKDNDQSALLSEATETSSGKNNSELPPSASEADDNIPSGYTENLTECSIIDPLEPSAKRARSSEACTEDARFTSEEATEEGCIAEERSVKSQSPQEVSGGLKVTIQVRSESRTTALQPACPEMNSTAGTTVHSGSKFCCYICKTSYQNLQNFQSHLVTAQHQQKIREIEHLSNACLVTLLPTAKVSHSSKDCKKKQPRWCNACQVHFSCDLIKHRQTKEHKMAKRSLRPFCTVCCRHFKTPRKFVEHMKSPDHKWKSQEVKLREKAPWNIEESEELITVDAVGCFEEEDEDDDDDDDEEEGISADDASENTDCSPVQGDENRTEIEEAEEYNPEKEYGLDYMVPVAGYLCRLCHKFYPSDSAARLTHCKSLVHFQNIQRCNAAKNRVISQVGASSLKMGDEGTKMRAAWQSDGGSDRGSTGSTNLASSRRARFSIGSAACEDTDSSGGFQAAPATNDKDPGYQIEPKMLSVKREEGSKGTRVVMEEEASCSHDTASGSRSDAHNKLQ